MEDRKKDHIDLAFTSRIPAIDMDARFFYEPILSAHPSGGIPETLFAGKKMRLPIWVSSMTGGTRLAGTINRNLAMACREFGMGMGLGSCRILLEDDTHLPDFDVRDLIGYDLPFYANLGINQLEILIEQDRIDLIRKLVDRLRADGIMIHVNPFQEWFQPEGDRLKHPPIDSVETLLNAVDFPVVVKEVGQGMGPESLRRLLALPLAAVEFAAFGGTNFAKLELLRSDPSEHDLFEPLSKIGHDAVQMLSMVNHQISSDPASVNCKSLIISGGIQTFLDGYYLIGKSMLPAVYGQASGFLKHAREDYETLRKYVAGQAKGLELAYAYLKIR